MSNQRNIDMSNPNPNQKSLDNLIYYEKGDTTDKAKNGALGGKASGESKRKKKTLAMIIQNWADGKPNDMMKKMLVEYGIPVPDDMNAMEALFAYAGVKVLDRKSSSGDVVKLVETVAKYTGQEPAKKIDISSDGLVSNIDRIKQMEEHFDK